MQSTIHADDQNAAAIEPAGPIVEVRLRGQEVLLTAGGNALVSQLGVADRALVAAALSAAVALTLNALATDIAVLGEPAGNA